MASHHASNVNAPGVSKHQRLIFAKLVGSRCVLCTCIAACGAWAGSSTAKNAVSCTVERRIGGMNGQFLLCGHPLARSPNDLGVFCTMQCLCSNNLHVLYEMCVLQMNHNKVTHSSVLLHHQRQQRHHQRLSTRIQTMTQLVGFHCNLAIHAGGPCFTGYHKLKKLGCVEDFAVIEAFEETRIQTMTQLVGQ